MRLSQKRIAAKILKCGLGRIWVDPSRLSDVVDAITSTDIKSLIKNGIIRKLPEKGISNYRKKKLMKQKKKGRRSGHGTRKGTRKGTKKRKWMANIRAQRKMLRELFDSGKISKKTYRHMYQISKSGFFRSRSHLNVHLQRLGLVEEEKGEKNVP